MAVAASSSVLLALRVPAAVSTATEAEPTLKQFVTLLTSLRKRPLKNAIQQLQANAAKAGSKYPEKQQRPAQPKQQPAGGQKFQQQL